MERKISLAFAPRPALACLFCRGGCRAVNHKEGPTMSIAAILQEIDQESATTRRVLERVPEDRLTWRPHAKSMSIGQLALHVATVPGFITGWALQDSVAMSGDFGPSEPKSVAEVLAAHDEGAKKAKTALMSLGDEGLKKEWR